MKQGKLEALVADNGAFFKEAIDQTRSEVSMKLATLNDGGGSYQSRDSSKLDKIAEEAERLRKETANLH
jgi:hypothetical protein